MGSSIPGVLSYYDVCCMVGDAIVGNMDSTYRFIGVDPNKVCTPKPSFDWADVLRYDIADVSLRIMLETERAMRYNPNEYRKYAQINYFPYTHVRLPSRMDMSTSTVVRLRATYEEVKLLADTYAREPKNSVNVLRNLQRAMLAAKLAKLHGGASVPVLAFMDSGDRPPIVDAGLSAEILRSAIKGLRKYWYGPDIDVMSIALSELEEFVVARIQNRGRFYLGFV